MEALMHAAFGAFAGIGLTCVFVLVLKARENATRRMLDDDFMASKDHWGAR